jgi:hypothetical protein
MDLQYWALGRKEKGMIDSYVNDALRVTLAK